MTTTVVLERDGAAEAGDGSAVLHEEVEVEAEAAVVVEGSSASDMFDSGGDDKVVFYDDLSSGTSLSLPLVRDKQGQGWSVDDF